MKALYELKEKLCEELEEMAEKADDMTFVDLENIHKLTDTIKNIDKIIMLEEEGGYSERIDRDVMYARDGSYNQGGGRGGNRGGGGGRSNRGGDGGYSMEDSGARKRDRRGRYSRDDGRDSMVNQLEDMMEDAGSDREREAIRRCMEQLRGA